MVANSTMHRFSNLVREKSIFFKIMWTISILVSAFSYLIFISQSFANFFKFQVTTTIRIQEEYQMNFPTLTFCAYSAYDEISNAFPVLNLNNISYCKFDSKDCNFSCFNDIKIASRGSYQHCLQFNYKMSNSNKEIMKMNESGYGKGLTIGFDLSPSIFTYFSVQDNHQTPLDKDCRHKMKSRMYTEKSIDKIVYFSKIVYL